MNNRYVLTLAAIEARLYTDEADSIFMRWPTAEKELPSGNHTPGGLSETCLHFMEDIMTKTGRPNHKWDNYLYLHFGGWDLLMDYVRRDPKRRGYLLRCEEKGYSVSGDRQYFDEALVSNGIVNGTAAAIPSDSMKCIIEANVYLVRRFCGLYSSATMDTLCREIRNFLETGSDEEKGLAPQMDPQDRYYIFMYIRSCLEQYEAAQADGADPDVLSGHLGTALAWLVLAALLRDSCENLCRLIPSPSIQLLRVQIRESKSSPAPAVAPASLPPVPGLFLGREKELEEIGRHWDNSDAPFFICGEGACGKTSLASTFASRSDRFTGIFAVYSGDLVSTIVSIRFRDTLPMDHADVDALYSFNLNRLTQFGSRILLIIDNFDAPGYDRTFTELLARGVDRRVTGAFGPARGVDRGVTGADGPARGVDRGVTGAFGPARGVGSSMTNADVLEDLMRAGVRLLFTTRTSVPPQYFSLCLSDAEHELPLGTLLSLAKNIYKGCPWTEYDEVLMSQIILAVGKHVMLVELLSAALQQQSCFTSLEEMLDKLESLQLPQIEGRVTTRRSAAAESSVYELMRRIFRFSSYEDPVRQMIRQLSLLSPLGMDREPFLQLIGWNNENEVRGTLLRLRDLHLVTIDPRTAHISMHQVLSDVAAADLKPDEHNCGGMIANAVQYFDEDSARLYDAKHLEQVSAMCARCATLLRGQMSGASSAGSEVPPVTVRLSLAVSGIEYRLGNYRAASSWAETALAELRDYGTSSCGTSDLDLHDRGTSDLNFGCETSDFDSHDRGTSGLNFGCETSDFDSHDRALLKVWADSIKCAARAYAKLGVYDQACEYYEKELELLPEDMKSEIAVALNDYGVLLEEMGRFEEAIDCLMSAWEIQKDLFGDDSPETISTCNNLGLICADIGDLEAAETFYRHALRISLEYYKEGHPETAVMYSNLGELLMHNCENKEDNEGEYVLTEGRLAESRHYLTKALEIATNAYGPSYPENACTLNNLGILEDMEGNHKEARGHYRKALEIQSAAAGSDHPHCADILHNLGVSYIDEALEPFPSPEAFSAASVEQKRDALPLLNKALESEQKALAILETVFGEGHSSVEMLRNEVGWLENELEI